MNNGDDCRRAGGRVDRPYLNQTQYVGKVKMSGEALTRSGNGRGNRGGQELKCGTE